MALSLFTHLSLLLVWSCAVVHPSHGQAASALPKPPNCPHCQTSCHGDRSVAYVVDTTGSMRNDIGQVCQRTTEMARALGGHGDIQRALLVPFGDPDIGPPQFFTSLDQLASAACDLRPSGGVDCPEKVLSGLLMGLESSCPQSTVYVFTDAVAKDVELLGKVLKIIQEKQIKVVFVLSGSCGSMEATYFGTIAAVSGGQLFRTAKSDVGDILKFSQQSINNEPQVSLLWAKTSPPFWTSDFVIEEGMTSVQVVVSCDDEVPTVELYKPGVLEPYTSQKPAASVSWSEFPQSVMVAINTASLMSLGPWQVHVTGQSQCRVSITAHGGKEVKSSFAKVTEINEQGEIISTLDPEEGSNYIVVEAPNSHIIQYVELVSANGDRFSTSSPTEGGLTAGSTGLQTVLGPAEVPGESFYLRYQGLQNMTDSKGHAEAKPFKRYSQMAMIPQANPSTSKTGTKIQAAHCQPLKMKCPKNPGVTAKPPQAEGIVLPAFWFYNSDALLPSTLANASISDSRSRSTLAIRQFRNSHAGVYSCYLAKSSGMVLAAEFNLTAEENTVRPCPQVSNSSETDDAEPTKPIPSVWRPQVATVNCLVLSCLAAELDQQHGSVRWMNTLSAHHYDRATIHRHYTVLRNGSLRICDPQPQHVGWYMCSTPRSPRPSAVHVTASDVAMESVATSLGTSGDDEDYEELIQIMEHERDAARTAAKVARERVAELEKSVVNYQRLMHNSDADRLHAMQSHDTCRTRLHRIRSALGLGNPPQE